MAIQINVTPVLIDVPAGTTVCKIDGPLGGPVSGGIITVPLGPPTDLVFTLQNGVDAALQFDRNGPWSCRAGGCPAPADQDPAHYPHANVDGTGKILTVRATPAGGVNHRHYSLNFNNATRFDPIIINQ